MTTAHTDGAHPEFVQRVGARVRALRREASLTVQELAEAAGLSRRMLTQIELGQANPSLATIDRVARALGTDFAGLALPAAGHSVQPVAPTRVWGRGADDEAVLLGATDAPRDELWRWNLAPGSRYDAEPDREGAQEIHHVLAGTLVLETPEGALTLTAGGTAVIRSDRPYSYANPGPEPVVFQRVVTGA